MAHPPVFLERRSYRRRRLMDAVRLLPLLVLALWMVPLMWTLPTEASSAAEPVTMSTALRYVFGIWCVTVAGGLALWWRARGPDGNVEQDAAATAGDAPRTDAS